MRNLNYELTITRGESFDLDFEIVNGDGTPYILYSKLENPHLVLTISSIYNSNTPYLCNYWMSLASFPKFNYTQPLPVQDFDSYPPRSTDGTIYNIVDDDLTGLIAVFVKVNDDGSREYKYWCNGEYIDYSLRIARHFSVTDTSELVSQNYLYSIRLVSGKELPGDDVPIQVEYDDILLPASKLTVRNSQNGGGYV